MIFHEDNQTRIRAVETGRNPSMRYLARTHRVSVAWLHETFSRQNTCLMYEASSKMCADIYTKAFTEVTKWQAACDLINIVDPVRLKQLLIEFSNNAVADDNVNSQAGKTSGQPALSSPFAPDPVRYEHSADTERPRYPPGRALDQTSAVDQTKSLSHRTLPMGGIMKTLTYSLY